MADATTERPICAACRKPLGEIAAFNPRYRPEPSYMHPECAENEKRLIATENLRVRNAARLLLEGCEVALPAILWAATHTDGNAKQFADVERKLRRAITEAKST